VALTPMGEALVEPARRILDQVRELPSIAAQARGEERPLRTAATTWAPTALVARFAAAVDEAGGDGGSGLELVEGSDDVVVGLLDGRLDLALLHLPVTEPELTVVPWLSYPLALAVRADDPLAGLDSVSLAELRDRRVVTSSLPARATNGMRRVIAMLQSAGVTRVDRVQGAPGGVEVAREVLIRGRVTFVPDLSDPSVPSVMPRPAFATVRIEDHGFGMDVGFAWRSAEACRSPHTSRLIERAVASLGGATAHADAPPSAP
jgi:DNA-binding transcriptional LysR family regulator